ncbi:MAG: methylase [Proteobacteria bacterium]|nr:MAG: methylase [Pseudomonadota bacterium]
MQRPYSEACERNKGPILRILSEAFADRVKVLEIGSGTGQHAVHFAEHLPHLQWQPSDVAEHLPGLQLWCQPAKLANLLYPIELDVDQPQWPRIHADAAFTANTLHIVSWPQVERLFEQIALVLPERGVLAVYGPFNYNRRHTSESNARFDLMLRQRDPHSGIRDFEDVDALAQTNGLRLVGDDEMPANNRTVVWERRG